MKTTQSTRIRYMALALCAFGGIFVSVAARADVPVEVVNHTGRYAMFRLGMANIFSKYYDGFQPVDTKWLNPGETVLINVPADGRVGSFVKIVDEYGHYYGKTPYTNGQPLYAIAYSNRVATYYDAVKVDVSNMQYPGPVIVSVWWGNQSGLEPCMKLEATVNHGEKKSIRLPIRKAGSSAEKAYLWTDTNEVRFIKRTATPAFKANESYQVKIKKGTDTYQPYDMHVYAGQD